MSDLAGAMLAVLAEDASYKPCVGCGVTADGVAIWQPTAECLAREFGLTDGVPRTAVYPLCSRCGEQARQSQAFTTRIEDAVVAALKAEGVIVGGEVSS